MDNRRFIAGPLSVLCIFTLVMGTASAAVITATDSSSSSDTGPSHHQSPETTIDALELKGVNVAEVKTSLQNGDTATVRAWLENHFQSDKPAMPDGSLRTPPDLIDSTQQEKTSSRLDEPGIGITEVRTEVQNGDTAAVNAWLENYVHYHEGEMPSCHHSGGALP